MKRQRSVERRARAARSDLNVRMRGGLVEASRTFAYARKNFSLVDGFISHARTSVITGVCGKHEFAPTRALFQGGHLTSRSRVTSPSELHCHVLTNYQFDNS